MKRKWFIGLLATASFAAGIVGLAACDKNGTALHDHVWGEWTVSEKNKPTAKAAAKQPEFATAPVSTTRKMRIKNTPCLL